MSSLMLGTNVVSTDEGCFSLKEINGPAPDYRSKRRWQVLTVVRGDNLVEFRRDLGLAASFPVDQFCIPGGLRDPRTGRLYLEHTVGELVDMADWLRSPLCERPARPKPTDLIQAYHDRPDRLARERVKRSIIGPLVRVQRD